jgi:protein FRA10AC1
MDSERAAALASMTALQRHYHFLKLGYKDDAAVVREAHQFLWEDEDRAEREAARRQRWGGAPPSMLTWEQRLAKRYHEKLHREYALADMTRYREGAIGLRWRTESEVFDGKGQFTCGNKACGADEHLTSFEVNFSYVERGVQKMALVKLRVCPACERRLHYRQRKDRKRERRKEKKQLRKEKRRRKHHRGRSGKYDRSRSNSESDSGSESESEDYDARAGGEAASSSVAAPASRGHSRPHRTLLDGATRLHTTDGRPHRGTPTSTPGRSVTEADGLEASFEKYCRELLA